MLYQKGLLQSELREAFSRLPKQDEAEASALRTVLASSAARAAYTKQVGGGGEEEEEEEETEEVALGLAGEDECPVCLEEFNTQRPEAVAICVTCQKPTHTECMRTWNRLKMQEGLPKSCVWCRSPWVETAAASPGAKAGVAGVKVSPSGYSERQRAHGSRARVGTPRRTASGGPGAPGERITGTVVGGEGCLGRVVVEGGGGGGERGRE